jgi:restriction system protein
LIEKARQSPGHHKNRIKREHVQMLYCKLVTLGARKAMLFSTSEFQEGAVEYAIQHGIALVWLAYGVKLHTLPGVRTPGAA